MRKYHRSLDLTVNVRTLHLDKLSDEPNQRRYLSKSDYYNCRSSKRAFKLNVIRKPEGARVAQNCKHRWK